MSLAQVITTSQKRYLDDGNPDGTVIGKTTSDLVGFFGNTPVAQQAAAATAITTTGVVTGGVFSTSTLTINFVNAVKEIQLALRNLGLIAD